MKKTLKCLSIIAVFFFCLTLPCYAEQTSDYDFSIVKTTERIVIDGDINPSEWTDARLVELNYEIDPGENTTPKVKTTAFVTFDNKYLYVAFLAYDDQPESIRAQLSDRDTPWQDDFVGICIDPFNSGRSGYEFFVNPRGVQMDLKRTEEKGEDASWDTIWDSAGKITDKGFQVEFAIPFKSFNFPSTSDTQTWGFWFYRVYPRDFRYQITYSPFDININCFFCQIPKVTGIQMEKPERSLELNPSAVIINSHDRESSDTPLISNGTSTQFGLNVKWSPTPNITSNITFNPEFSDVEADAAQLSINRQFSLFYKEKRPFFLENADVFETVEPIVHTRTIADPSFGIKVTGKNGKHSWGGFFAEDSVTSFLQPSNSGSQLLTWNHTSTAAVLRGKRDIFSNSSIGTLITHRSGGGYNNTVFGIDGKINLSVNHSFLFQVLASDSQNPSVENNDRLNGEKTHGMMVSMGYAHESRKWNGYVWYDRRGKGFRADLGFISKVDFEGIIGDLNYTIYWEKESFFSKIIPEMLIECVKDLSGNVIERSALFQTKIYTSSQGYGLIYWNTLMDYYQGKRHNYDYYGIFIGGKPFRFLDYNLGYRAGESIDYLNNRLSHKESIETQLIFFPDEHIKVDLNLNQESLTFEGSPVYKAKILQGNFIYNFSNRFFIRTVLQYTTIRRNQTLYNEMIPNMLEKNLYSQFLLNYKINARTLCYLGFSGGKAAIEMDHMRTMNKAVFFKISYAYSFNH